MRWARANCPPIWASASNKVTAWPRCAAVTAKLNPAGPAPTTASFFGWGVGVIAKRGSASRQAWGLTKQPATLPTKMASKQPWLQAMQVLMSASRCWAALLTKSGSASSGRAIETMSAQPAAKTASAVAGVLMRLVVISGMRSLPISRWVTHAKLARGTQVAMVGIRASCQPMPVLISVAPAASTAKASCKTSSNVLPSSTKSSIDKRKITINCSPTASRTAFTTATGKRIRLM